ncbi:MAG: MFS transporter [Promethearchaeota archaeon]
MTTFSIGSITGSLITTIKKDFKHKIKINIIGASLFFVGQIFAILAPKGNFILMMIALFPGAVVFPITVSTYLAILQSSVPKDKVGRIMSIDHMISMAIAPIGALISGPLANLFGIVNLFLVCAFIGMIYPIFIWIFTKIRHLEYPTEEVEEALEDVQVIELAEIIE